jgi:DNA polymerase-3 subunit delta'
MPWALLGLERIKAALTDLLRQERVPHALLLTGPAGCGKFTLSLALAQALNCAAPDPADLSPCLECPSCRKMAANSHPDLVILEPKGRLGVIPIDEVRALRSTLAYKPFEARRQVAVVRGAERFREESGGALLKTLEEPNPGAVIILNALSESAVMPTLVSRCARLRIPPLQRELILKAMAERGHPPDRAALLAGLSGGTLGAAMGLDAETAERIFSEIDTLLGLSGRPGALSAALDWTKGIADEIAKLKKREETWPRARDLQDLAVACLRLWHRDVAVLAATLNPGATLGPPASSARFSWSRTMTAARSRSFERAVERLADGLARPTRLEIVFENFWLSVLEY